MSLTSNYKEDFLDNSTIEEQGICGAFSFLACFHHQRGQIQQLVARKCATWDAFVDFASLRIEGQKHLYKRKEEKVCQ